MHRKLTIGLDLGDRSSWYCMLDEAGGVIGEQKLSTTPKAMKEVFATMRCRRVALEAGMHSPWVSRMLSELGHEVIVAHARNVRLIGDRGVKRAVSHPVAWSRPKNANSIEGGKIIVWPSLGMFGPLRGSASGQQS